MERNVWKVSLEKVAQKMHVYMEVCEPSFPPFDMSIAVTFVAVVKKIKSAYQRPSGPSGRRLTPVSVD